MCDFMYNRIWFEPAAPCVLTLNEHTIHSPFTFLICRIYYINLSNLLFKPYEFTGSICSLLKFETETVNSGSKNM